MCYNFLIPVLKDKSNVNLILVYGIRTSFVLPVCLNVIIIAEVYIFFTSYFFFCQVSVFNQLKRLGIKSWIMT